MILKGVVLERSSALGARSHVNLVEELRREVRSLRWEAAELRPEVAELCVENLELRQHVGYGKEMHRWAADRAAKRALDVARVGEIAEGEVEIAEAGDETGFEPAVVLHPFGQTAADDADTVPLLEWNVSDQSGGSEPQKEASEQLPCDRKILSGRAKRVAYPGRGGRRRAGTRCPRQNSPPEGALFRFAGVVARQAQGGTGAASH